MRRNGDQKGKHGQWEWHGDIMGILVLQHSEGSQCVVETRINVKVYRCIQQTPV